MSHFLDTWPACVALWRGLFRRARSSLRALVVVAVTISFQSLPGADGFETAFGICTSGRFQQLLVGTQDTLSLPPVEQTRVARALLTNPDLAPSKLEGCSAAIALRQFLAAIFLGEKDLDLALEWLARIWWSELLVTHWAPLFLDIARQAVYLINRVTPGYDALRSALSDVNNVVRIGMNALEVDLRDGNVSSSFHAIARRVDSLQELSLQHAFPRGEVPELLGALSDVASIEYKPRAWWVAETQMWISVYCGDILTCITYCMPLFQEAVQTPLLSRHRFFAVYGDDCKRDLETMKSTVPLALELLPEPPSESSGALGYELAVLAAHRRLVDRAVDERIDRKPTLVLALDVVGARDDGDSALSHVWDVDRWLLHGDGEAYVRKRSWDALFFFSDGPGTCTDPSVRCTAPMVMQCTKDGLLIPRTSVMLVRASRQGSAFLHTLQNAAVRFAGAASGGGKHEDFKLADFPSIASGGLATLLTEGDDSRLRKTALQGETGLWTSGAQGELGLRGIRAVGIRASVWRSAALPATLLPRRRLTDVRRPRGAAPPDVDCERHSTGGVSKMNGVRGASGAGQSLSMGNCVSQPKVLNGGAGALTRVDAGGEIWFCPRRVPVAVHALLRVGSHSVANWAAGMDSMEAWVRSVLHLSGDVLGSRDTWTPSAFKPPCCARGAGRLLLAVVRSPFERLRSYFRRRENPAHNGLAFPDWCRWALARIRAGDPGVVGGSATSSGGASLQVWTESDALHLAPLRRELLAASPPLDLATFAPVAAAADDASVSATSAKDSRGGRRLLLVTRLERMNTDAAVAERLLRERFGFQGPPLPGFPWSHASIEGGSAKTHHKETCCPWVEDVVKEVLEVYAEELELGGYPRDAAALAAAGASAIGRELPAVAPRLLEGPAGEKDAK